MVSRQQYLLEAVGGGGGPGFAVYYDVNLILIKHSSTVNKLQDAYDSILNPLTKRTECERIMTNLESFCLDPNAPSILITSNKIASMETASLLRRKLKTRDVFVTNMLKGGADPLISPDRQFFKIVKTNPSFKDKFCFIRDELDVIEKPQQLLSSWTKTRSILRGFKSKLKSITGVDTETNQEMYKKYLDTLSKTGKLKELFMKSFFIKGDFIKMSHQDSFPGLIYKLRLKGNVKEFLKHRLCQILEHTKIQSGGKVNVVLITHENVMKDFLKEFDHPKINFENGDILHSPNTMVFCDGPSANIVFPPELNFINFYSTMRKEPDRNLYTDVDKGPLTTYQISQLKHDIDQLGWTAGNKYFLHMKNYNQYFDERTRSYSTLSQQVLKKIRDNATIHKLEYTKRKPGIFEQEQIQGFPPLSQRRELTSFQIHDLGQDIPELGWEAHPKRKYLLFLKDNTYFDKQTRSFLPISQQVLKKIQENAFISKIKPKQRNPISTSNTQTFVPKKLLKVINLRQAIPELGWEVSDIGWVKLISDDYKLYYDHRIGKFLPLRPELAQFISNNAVISQIIKKKQQ